MVYVFVAQLKLDLHAYIRLLNYYILSNPAFSPQGKFITFSISFPQQAAVFTPKHEQSDLTNRDAVFSGRYELNSKIIFSRALSYESVMVMNKTFHFTTSMSSNLPLYTRLYGTNIKFRRVLYILDNKKKVLDEFSTADEENEGTTESEVTGCI